MEDRRCVETLLLNEAYLLSLNADIDKAQFSIDLETYIFNDDPAGQQIAKALSAAASRGVKVRVLVDGVGTPWWGGLLAANMEKAGVQIRVYHPLPLFLWQWGRAAHFPSSLLDKSIAVFSKINFRNHRKTCLIDKKILYIGSANIALNKNQNGKDWRETTIKLQGVDLEDMEYAFEKAWNHISLRKRIKKFQSRNLPTGVLRLNYAYWQRRRLYKELIARIMHCQNRIWITSAYFVPDDSLLNSLIKAKQRGLDVKLLIPQKSDVKIMSFVVINFYSILIKHGIEIYEYLPSVLHAKILILDDWYIVGSSNLNYRSFKYDLEVDLRIQTKTVQIELAEQFLRDLTQAKKVEMSDLKKLPFYKKFLARLILIFRHWI